MKVIPFRLAAAFAAALLAFGAFAPPANDFRFAIVGDRTGTANAAAYEQVWKEIGAYGPDFVINVGDTIEGHNGARAASEWKDIRALWSRYSRFRLYLVPGNHDIWDEPSRALYEKASGRPPSYSFDYQQAHFTILDNSRTNDLAEDQLRFLETDLDRNRDRSPKFVFFHKPYWILFLKLGSGEFLLHQLARKYGVDYVVSGHGHQLLALARDGITYIEVGSSGANIARGLERGEGYGQGWFYQYLRARVNGAKTEFTVKELDPPCGKGRTARVAP